MHNGQIGGYEKVRRKLESLIPDAYYAQRVGTTDSELMFLMLLAKRLEKDPAGAVRATMAEIELAMGNAAVKAPLRFTAALTDGKCVYATRYASDAKPPSLYYCTENDLMIIVFEPLEAQGRDWQPVPVNHLLAIDAQGGTTTTALH